MQVSTIGVDLAKNVFQVHGVDSPGKVVITRQLRRNQVIDFFSKIPPCLVGMEACGTAHHWAREVSKLGHTVRLMPPSYVKGYSRCNSSCSTRPATSAKASLGYEATCQEAGQARRRCGCQQDGAHRLGDHGQGRMLSSAGACCSRLKRLGNGSVRRRRSKTIELRG